MIGRTKAFLKRRWPALRLRTILLTVLLFAAAMPGFGAVFLRVYENALVRQTEAELIAQGAALAAAAEAFWPGASPAVPRGPERYRPELTTVDLSSSPVLPERPPAAQTPLRPAPQAAAVAAVLAPVVERTARTTLASILLLDANGVVVFGHEQGRRRSTLTEVRGALAGATVTTLRRNGSYRPRYSLEWLSRASALRIHHARPIRVNGRVVGVLLLSRSPRALFRGIHQDRFKIALGVAVIFGLLVVLSGLVSRGVTRPVEALTAATREVAAGRGGAVPDPPATAAVEIRTLYENFRSMADAITRRSRYLRDFAAAVSHEFKTPLAGIRGAVELLEDHGDAMTEAERRRFLSAISADSDRLTHLVGRLLDLARADMASPETGAPVEVATPVRRAADASGGLDIALHLPPTLPQVAVPEATLEAVLTTLLENSRQAGARAVAVSAAADGTDVALWIQDDGPGVPAADRERIFEPFFTGRRAEGGTGLGLPIACSLLEASHGSLSLAPSDRGARFEVRLPRA